MHDVDHDYEDVSLQNYIYLHDNVELTTIGVDVGSSTFHLMFARVHLQRAVQDHSSTFEVVERTVLWRSEIHLTPYIGKRIDTDAVRRFVAESHLAAGLRPDEIDSGAVILTGEALRQHNARALADAIAEGSGKFVCVSAGHHLESMLAAFGSGAVKYSADYGLKLFHIDVGGGTTKLSFIDNGRVIATAAVMIGGRQIAMNIEREVVSTSAGSTTVARAAGVAVKRGGVLTPNDEAAFVQSQVGVLVDLANCSHSNDLERKIRLTRVLPRDFVPDAISFSGGVSEYIYGRETKAYGDLGPQIGKALSTAIAGGEFRSPIVDPGEGIRATVAGASQCSVQLSGSTVLVSHPAMLPVHNVPVVHPDLNGRLAERGYVAEEVAQAVRAAVTDYGLLMEAPLAFAFTWAGDPSYQRIQGFAQGIQLACGVESDSPAIILIDQDIGASVGRLLMNEYALKRPVVCLDGLELSPLDFVDVGQIVEPSGALPVVIKSLLFGDDR